MNMYSVHQFRVSGCQSPDPWVLRSTVYSIPFSVGVTNITTAHCTSLATRNWSTHVWEWESWQGPKKVSLVLCMEAESSGSAVQSM